MNRQLRKGEYKSIGSNTLNIMYKCRTIGMKNYAIKCYQMSTVNVQPKYGTKHFFASLVMYFQ